MKQCLWILLLTSLLSCTPKLGDPNEFRFHLFTEPLHLDPAKSRGSSSSYFFLNTLRGLYIYKNDTGLSPEGGQCSWVHLRKLKCEIYSYSKWSDGVSVTSMDYKRAFIHLINPFTASPRADILKNLKNAVQILQGKLPPESLGFKIVSTNSFLLNFDTPDPEFLFKLSSTALFPKPKNQPLDRKSFKNFISNGPYKIASWDFGRQLRLTPNPFYAKGHPKRPHVKIYFIDNELTAFRLYESGRLNFLRRIPSNFIHTLKNRSDFIQVPMARYDYLGFGKKIKDLPLLRKALALSINYSGLKKLVHSNGTPGCPSIPAIWMDIVPCYKFDPIKAKKILSQIPMQQLSKSYKLKVSQMGGADIKKQAEYFQAQWKKHLDLNIEVSQVEQKVFLNELRNDPPNIFRKGVGLDRPTCTSALETFSTESRQNFILWKDKAYQDLLKKISQEPNEVKKKKLCRQGVEMIMDDYQVIPLGEMHFTMMARPKFRGWSINSMNQLDLSQLHLTPHKNP